MKFFAVLAAASIAVTSADNCDLTKLTPVVLAANGAQCTKDSGVTFIPPSVPSTDKIPGLCKSTACRAFLKELKAAAPTECTVTISTPPLELYAALINPLEKTCGPDPAAPTTAPTTTTAKPDDKATTAPTTTTAKPDDKKTEAPTTTTAKPDDKKTEAPATTTAKPDAKESTEGGSQKEAGSAGSGMEEQEVTKTPANKPTSAVPTPKPTSGASTVVAAACAIVAAVAASFF